MLRFILWSVLALLSGAALMLLVRHDIGYVLVSVGEYTVETSFWFACAVIIILAILFRWIYQIVRVVWQSVFGSYVWFASRGEKQAKKKMLSGFTHYVEGDWLAAKRDLLRSAKKSDQPLIHYLTAARSAHEMGELDEAQDILLQAEKIAPKDSMALLLGRARIYIQQKNFELGLVTLKRLLPKHDKNASVLVLLKDTYLGLCDFDALVNILPKLERYSGLSAEDLDDLKLCVYTEILKKTIEGKVTALHGSKGALRVLFERGMPGQAIGQTLEVKA